MAQICMKAWVHGMIFLQHKKITYACQIKNYEKGKGIHLYTRIITGAG